MRELLMYMFIIFVVSVVTVVASAPAIVLFKWLIG
jgi:hypothetical protein